MSGIVHELNDPLAVIKNMELILHRDELSPQTRAEREKLSIAHSIITDHRGGRLQAPSGGAAPPLPAEKTRSARILILDDDTTITELLGEMLGLLGHSAVLCHSATEALDLIGRQEFDLILSDFRMPRMNGQEFYHRAVREKPSLSRRIVFLTGDVLNEDVQTFLESTGNPHLAKPFHLAHVEQTVARVLHQSAVIR